MEGNKAKTDQETHDDEHIHEVNDEEEDDHAHNENLQCRFYRKDFPEENDLVIVNTPFLIPYRLK